MYSSRASTRIFRQARPSRSLRCTYATTPYSTPAPHPSRITTSDINAARKYCSNLLQNFDSPAYTLQTFLPPSSLDAYLSIRALNIELARIPDLISNPTVGALRLQFWRDNLNRTFANTPPQEPVAILLHHALSTLRSRYPSMISLPSMKNWCMKVVDAREKYLDNRPYASMEDLETYAEKTYSSLMYLTLASLPLHSLAADHLASHIGKATGIVAVLRGIPLIAFPPPPNTHSNNSAFNGQLGGQVGGGGRHGAVMLPLDVMAEAGVKEEEVFRRGAEAEGLRDAVFRVATRANDHLITVGEMLRNLQGGEDIGHEFEHEGEVGHEYVSEANSVREEDSASGMSGANNMSTSTASSPGKSNNNRQLQEVYRGFGALMPAVSTKLWLERLEKYDFDVFRPELRVREWKLPWRAYWAFRRKKL